MVENFDGPFVFGKDPCGLFVPPLIATNNGSPKTWRVFELRPRIQNGGVTGMIGRMGLTNVVPAGTFPRGRSGRPVRASGRKVR